MRLTVAISTAMLLTGSLLACSSGYNVPRTTPMFADGSAQSHVMDDRSSPHWSSAASAVPVAPWSSRVMARLGRTDSVTPGIYAGEFRTNVIYGYSDPDSSNEPPVCSAGPASDVNDIAVDRKGDLIDPDGGTGRIIVFAGPGLCGPKLGSVLDPYGQPSDAASRDVESRKASGDTIVVGNVFDNGRSNDGIPFNDLPGSVSLCTLSRGCTRNLTNPNMRLVFGVALAENGDCWASAANTSNAPTLTYFARCSGRGVAASGFKNPYPGGLDIDKNGNLVAVSDNLGGTGGSSQLYVYSGCNPACKLVAGPFRLFGGSEFGHLDSRSKSFVAGDWQYGQLDVYSYSASGITYEYSISNGLLQFYVTLGAAFSPRSKE